MTNKFEQYSVTDTEGHVSFSIKIQNLPTVYHLHMDENIIPLTVKSEYQVPQQQF